LLNAGLIDEVSATLYANINSIIQDLYAADPNFAELEYAKKQEAANQMAAEILSGSKTTVPPTPPINAA
jgi:hypothetical protein